MVFFRTPVKHSEIPFIFFRHFFSDPQSSTTPLVTGIEKEARKTTGVLSVDETPLDWRDEDGIIPPPPVALVDEEEDFTLETPAFRLALKRHGRNGETLGFFGFVLFF